MKDWQSIAKEKREQVFAKIPSEWILKTVPSASEEPDSVSYISKLMTDEENAITSSTIRNLVSAIVNGKLTALEVTRAFCHRAALAHQILNCCSEIFFDKALEQARLQDEYFERHGKTLGPFHGIPISLKDQVNLPGLDSAMGYVALLNKPKNITQQAVIADCLKKLGAIFYVKTTVPMAMMSFDTYSNIYGKTSNAINRKLSAGGSSGGEGALVGSRGSLLGLGTDIGGSIRVPSSFNGLYGLRPSNGRFPYHNCTNSYTGQTVIQSVIGPIAQDIEDLEYFCENFFATEPWLYDPFCVPMKWNKFEIRKEDIFSFGVMDSDDIIHPSAPVKRAIKLVKTALSESQHGYVTWEPQDHKYIADIADLIYEADAGKEVRDLCETSGEPVTVNLSVEKEQSITEYWKNTDKILEFRKRYFDYWNSTAEKTATGRPVDAWIAPIWPSPAFEEEIRPIPLYPVVQNVLDCSSIVIPVLRADKDIDHISDDRYDAELQHGTPVGLQIITRKLHDEKAVAFAKLLKQLLETL